MKPSSRAFLLEGGIVGDETCDDEKCDEPEEGVVAIAVSLLFSRGPSASTRPETDLGFKSTVTCSASSSSPFDVVCETEPVGTCKSGASGEVAN